MNSNILNQIGLGNIDIGFILIGITVLLLIFIILAIIQFSNYSKLNKRYKKFMQGKDAKSLEKDIIGLYEDNKFLRSNSDKNRKDIRTLYKNMEMAYQKCGIVKYDAFQQMGGKLSFSLAMLNEKNDGFIMNSVHSTDGCYSYTKIVKDGNCDISLGEEERQALNIAMGVDEE